MARQHGGGGRGGRSGGGSGGRGNGESGGNHNRGNNGNNDDDDRGRGGSSGNGNSGGRGSGNGNSNGNGQGDDSGDDNSDNNNNNNNNSGGNSNSGGDGDDQAKSSTKTQKKTTAAAARTSTKSPSKATSTTKAKAAASPTKEAASPVQTKKVDASTSTPSPKSKSPSTADAVESPVTQETGAPQATDRGSSPSSNSQATDLPVAVTAGSSGGSGQSSGATRVAGAPGRTTETPSSQSPASGGGGHNGSANVGGIAAGVVVGIIALLVLIFLGWRFRRSKMLAPLFSRFQSKGDDTQARQAMSSSPNMGESLIVGAGAMARGRGDGNRSPPAYEETKAALEPAVTPLAQPVAAVTRSRSHRTHQSTGSIHRKPVPAGYGDRPRPVPSMVENPNRVPISLMPGPMRVRRATSPSSSTRSPPPYQDGARGGPGVHRPPAPKWTANNLPVPPPEPQSRESSDIGDRRTTNHSGWSSLLPTSGDAADADARRRDSFVSVGGVSIASSGVISPSVLNWPMPPSTPPTMSVTNLSDDSRQSVQGTSLRAPEQSKAARQVYQSRVQMGPSRINRPGATGPSQMGDGAEVLTASTITFQQPSRTVVRVQRRSTQSSTPSSTPSSERSEPRQARNR